MESNEQKDSTSLNTPIYDYIYRDSSRVASYYAQMFDGLLEAMESESYKRATDAGSIEEPAPREAFANSLSNSVGRTRRKTFTPHDTITRDVISRLLEPTVATQDIENAPQGAVVLVKGSVIFVDSSVPHLVAGMFPLLATQGTIDDIPEGVSPEFIGTVMSSISFPAAFLLQTELTDKYELDIQVVGTLKEEGMEEPISSFYFKYGSDGMSDVYLLGIKEERSQSITIPDAKMLGMAQNVGQMFSDMVFPEDAIRVTPIAMFRRLQRSQTDAQ